MPVDPDDIASISRTTVEMYRQVELRLIQLVASYLQRGMDAPTWATDRLAAASRLRRQAALVLDRLLERLAGDTPGLLAQAYRTGSAASLLDIPEPPRSVRHGLVRSAQQAIAVIPRTAAMESLAAAVVTDTGQRHANVLRHVLDVYRQVIASATTSSIGAGFTRRAASQQAYAAFVDRGVASFTDVAGRQWRLSSYVEMALRTVTQRAAVQGQTDRQQALGLDLVIVSNEAQECARCRPWENKVLSLNGSVGQVRVESLTTGEPVTVDVAGTLEQARAAGLQHPNCRHSIRAYLPGATRVPTGPTADPAGDEARQQQRHIERQIRRWKEREAGSLTPDATAGAGARVRHWQVQMREHLDANPDLKRLSYREQIGAGNIPPSS